MAEIGLYIVVLICFGILIGYMGSKRGGNFFLWWAYGSVALPVALIHLGVSSFGGFGQKRCGFCRRMVRVNLSHCPRCGYEFITDEGKHL